MRSYCLKIALVAALLYLVPLGIVAFVRSPIPAGYPVRDWIIVKHRLGEQLPPPKIILLSGSNTLFGLDALQMERELGVPTLNFGLHNALRLEDILKEGERAARPGDLVVLLCEPNYYVATPRWTGWQVRNAIAWNPRVLDERPWSEKLYAFVMFGTRALAQELIVARWQLRHGSPEVRKRLAALAPEEEIFQRYLSGTEHSEDPYDFYNFDRRGDVPWVSEARYKGPAPGADQPGAIDNRHKRLFRDFVAAMKDRGVRVVFAHTPYIVDGAPVEGWREAETAFQRDIASIGSLVIDRREALFLSRSLFYDTELHLNGEGRLRRTRTVIDALREKGVVPVPVKAPAPAARPGPR